MVSTMVSVSQLELLFKASSRLARMLSAMLRNIYLTINLLYPYPAVTAVRFAKCAAGATLADHFLLATIHCAMAL